MKTYPKMKNSGIKWIGKIPEEWDVKRLKFTTSFDLSTVDRHEYDDEIQVSICHYPQVYNNEIISSTTELSSGTCNTKELEKFRLKKDDVLITKDSETPDDIGVPVYIQDDFKDVVSGYHIAHLTSDKRQILGIFLFRFLQSDISNAYFETEANGVTRYGLGKDSISNLKLVLPTILEQKSMSEYLNTVDFKISEEITKNQKLVELLKEKRQSTINQAVTKGLDLTVPMKDSGIESIGKIPENWHIIQLKELIKHRGLVRGPFGSSLKIDSFVEKGFKVYEQKNAIYQNLDLGNSYVDEDKFSEMSRFSIQTDDFLMSCSGTIGKLVYVPEKHEEGIINQALLIIRYSFEKMDLGFITHFMNSFVFQSAIIDNSQGGVMKNLVGLDIFKKIGIVIPDSKSTQKQIATFLNLQTSKIDSLILKTESQIEKLQEFHQSLISSAVTGKIDVRQEIVA